MAITVEETYRSHGPMVLRRCRALLREEEKAVDAMHDVFVEVLRRPTLTSDAISSLLYRIATNVCLNRLRAERRHPETDDEELLLRIAALDELEERAGAAFMLSRLFGREPESSRTIAVLHLLDGLTLEETAEVVGLSVSGVRKRLRTLRVRLEQLEAA